MTQTLNTLPTRLCRQVVRRIFWTSVFMHVGLYPYSFPSVAPMDQNIPYGAMLYCGPLLHWAPTSQKPNSALSGKVRSGGCRMAQYKLDHWFLEHVGWIGRLLPTFSIKFFQMYFLHPFVINGSKTRSWCCPACGPLGSGQTKLGKKMFWHMLTVFRSTFFGTASRR